MAFPKVKFVAGHAGLSQWLEIKEMAAVHKNLYIDCTFKGVKTVQELIDAFGPERVLFGAGSIWYNKKSHMMNKKDYHETIYSSLTRLFRLGGKNHEKFMKGLREYFTSEELQLS